MRLIFNTFFHLEPACGRQDLTPEPSLYSSGQAFLPTSPTLSRSDSYRKQEGLTNRFRAASHFFFCNGLKPGCSQIGHGYAVRAWIRSNRFRAV